MGLLFYDVLFLHLSVKEQGHFLNMESRYPFFICHSRRIKEGWPAGNQVMVAKRKIVLAEAIKFMLLVMLT